MRIFSQRSTNIEHSRRGESMRQLRHPKAEEITLTGVLAALSDPVRLSIVFTLAEAGDERAWSDFDVEV